MWWAQRNWQSVTCLTNQSQALISTRSWFIDLFLISGTYPTPVPEKSQRRRCVNKRLNEPTELIVSFVLQIKKEATSLKLIILNKGIVNQSKAVELKHTEMGWFFLIRPVLWSKYSLNATKVSTSFIILYTYYVAFNIPVFIFDVRFNPPGFGWFSEISRVMLSDS